MKDAEQVTFGGAGLDRAGHLRADPAALQALLEQSDCRIVPFWRGKPMLCVRGDTVSLGYATGNDPISREAASDRIFLGLHDGSPLVAIDISGWEPQGQDTTTVGAFVDPSEQVYPGMPQGYCFTELRSVMTRLSPQDAEIAAMARAVIAWHGSHGFCAKCGSPSDIAEGGWQRLCPACGTRHFPRTDPVAIMLVTHGNSVLLGRSPGWPDGMYSLLAGFIEPGETVEAAVRREVFEESRVRVGEVGYLASQPWPFPASLMIGCHGHALSTEIVVDPVELEDALWITREELLAVHAGESTRLKPARRGAIAHFLLSRWMEDRLD